MLSPTALTDTAREISREVVWLTEIITIRFQLYFSLETNYTDITEHPPPLPEGQRGAYGQLIEKYRLNFDERIAVALSLTARLHPRSLDVFFTKNKTYDRPFVEFGGVVTGANGAFVPTGDTLLFILAGTSVEQKMEKIVLLGTEHRLFKYRILELRGTDIHATRESHSLHLSPETEAQLIWQQPYQPRYGTAFPAHLLETDMEWEDLILPAHTKMQIEEIQSWIRHGDTLMDGWGMRKKLRPGYRALFYGSPGTGKSMTAALLGKLTASPVYRVDLSMVVSKFIGETEKNLAKVFDQAEYRGWILFFDEADALFGKRTQIQDAHDRYANQEVSYLLQRIEQFDGIVILASNFRSNLDEAFTRRFESIIRFDMPKPAERMSLWEKGFSPKAKERFAPDVDLREIARNHEIAGGAIMNVVRQVSLRAIARNAKISRQTIVEGIRKEFEKDGRTV